MKSILSDSDRNRLDQRVAEAEKRTGAQIVLAIVRRSDAYTELPWKAFALGASIAGLAVCIADAFSDGWTYYETLLPTVAAVLGAGVAFAFLTVLVPRFARIFLTGRRAETEVRQYAESLFLRRELSATHGRNGVLLLVSLFERRVVLLPDKGLAPRLAHDTMHGIIVRMIPLLAKNDVRPAFETGLEGLSKALESNKPAGSGKNELADQIIEEKGA